MLNAFKRRATAGPKLKKNGSLTGEICFHNGDDLTFKARRW